ncbi:MAG: hypothetical protein PHV47_02570 [Candidatus Pacebacteria bacterium]|nr:hypothetical protein [Candidatus Paceibacterota bacterium]
MEQDKELKAINDILSSLNELKDDERLRIIKYVIERFRITNLNVDGNLSMPDQSFPIKDTKSTPIQSTCMNTPDIRTLREQKNPRSAIQMVVLVAYYLKEVATVKERKEVINTNDIEKYFKQAGYRLPVGKHGAADTLNNAKNAGYLEAAARGTYKLNPVGYNLIAYVLPENNSGHEKKKNNKNRKERKIARGRK